MKTGTKCCSRSTNEAVSSMGRLPCLGAYLVCLAPDRMPESDKEADINFRGMIIIQPHTASDPPKNASTHK